jgi:hypothetical protein
VIEKLDSLNHYILSEAKERQMREQEKPSKEKKNEGDNIEENLEEIEK